MKYKSSFLKLTLIIFLSVISLTTITYNYYLLNTLREKERSSIQLWAKAIEHNGTPQNEQTRKDLNLLNKEILGSETVNKNDKSRWSRLLQRVDAELANSALDFVATEIIIKNRFEVPSFVSDSTGEILYTRNIDVVSDSAELLSEFRSMNLPIKIKVGNDESFAYQYVHYGESRTIQLLKYFPYIQLFFLTLFITIAYYSWSIVRQNEQSSLWVGMAKEAAHQLGTPLSSLYGWITLLESDELTKSQKHEIIFELANDADRMQKVADRFNKIGSAPELKEQRIEPLINQVLDYLEPRIPRLNKGVVLFRELKSNAKLPINAELFEWAIENVVKNAIDAIVPNQDGSYVKVISYQLEKEVIIIIEDTGKGIEKKNTNLIFKPGFSTKKRGWGLGLSLTKRIIEEYHKGKIELVKSEQGKGAIFQITLKVN
ncbi:MAG: HAMP domain-containing histidine kinase [Bacteroidetes bacterium]|nr:HAMP domain-containing histidine kinase [Bacteroidota bacterium]